MPDPLGPEELIGLLEAHSLDDYAGDGDGRWAAFKATALDNISVIRDQREPAFARNDTPSSFDVPPQYTQRPELWIVLDTFARVFIHPVQIEAAIYRTARRVSPPDQAD
jgi:hypothetical protein